MPRVLSAAWSLSIRTDAGTVRKSGADLETLADAIDDLYEDDILEFYTAVDEEDDDDGDDDDPTALDDELEELPEPPDPGAPSPDSPL